MDQEQFEYLRKREAQELEAIDGAADEKAIRIHREMAERYAELAQRVSGDVGATPTA